MHQYTNQLPHWKITTKPYNMVLAPWEAEHESQKRHTCNTQTFSSLISRGDSLM